MLDLAVWKQSAALFFFFASLGAMSPQQEKDLAAQGAASMAYSRRVAAQFYDILESGEAIKEITNLVLTSDLTRPLVKKRLEETGRRIFIFQYPSDGLQIKGYISFVPQTTPKPLLMYVRGGNRLFGVPHPAHWSTMGDYTIVATTYRGGVSEGEDQFGGDDTHDVENVVKYLPILEQALQLQVQYNKVYMLGESRGGGQMFLALGRSPELQQKITKAVSLSGLLDMQQCIQSRPDMVRMFIKDFGLVPGENDQEWVERRNPIAVVPQLRKDLPFLILQGTDDARVSISQGRAMVAELQKHGAMVDYVEVEDGSHCLGNKKEYAETLIAQWLEQ